jgi:hypothetical protein
LGTFCANRLYFALINKVVTFASATVSDEAVVSFFDRGEVAAADLK